MSSRSIQVLIDRQAALIKALDSGEISAIELATQQMASAVKVVSAQGVWSDRSELDQLNYAMKQTHAARIRVNYLSEWTRQKIDQFAELRGLKTTTSRSKY